MGCISSIPGEDDVEQINVEQNFVNEQDADNIHSSLSNHSHNLRRMPSDSEIHRSLQHIASLRLQDWTTNDLICYISSIEDGKFCDPKYDTFKTQLFALGIDGNTIHTICYDPYYLKDLGLNNDNDIILMQTKCAQLYSNSEHIHHIASKHDKKEQNIAHHEAVDEDFFPLNWKFPLRETEQIKNSHYVGQILFIQSTKAQIPCKCIYIENNWIVVRYKNTNKASVNNDVSLSNDTNNSNSVVPPLNASNVYKHMERIHAINESKRISKTKAMKDIADDDPNNAQNGTQFQMENSENYDIFDGNKNYGLSFCSSGSGLGVVAIPNCYTDPITYEIMTNPVTSTTSGRTYDKDMILKHIANYGTDPFNQQAMSKDDLFDNIDLKRAIVRWLQNNPNVTGSMC